MNNNNLDSLMHEIQETILKDIIGKYLFLEPTPRFTFAEEAPGRHPLYISSLELDRMRYSVIGVNPLCYIEMTIDGLPKKLEQKKAEAKLNWAKEGF